MQSPSYRLDDASMRPQNVPLAFQHHKLNLLVLAGCAAVILGSFAPAADVALYGTVSYWEAAGPEALILILAAIGSAACLAIGKPKVARLCTLAMWASLMWPYLQGVMEPEPEGFLAETAAAVVDTTTGFATDIALNFVDITWGTLLLALGCLGVTAGVWRKPGPREP